MIVIDNVTLTYPYDRFDVLKGVSFTVCEGVNTILADAQSGKTSICRLLLRDIEPTGGKIFVEGQQISCITSRNLDILYLPSNPVFFERKSAQYNMEYPLKIRKVSKLERRNRVREIATQLGVPLEVKVCKLSPQQRRTLALARGLTVEREIALFDDFFDGDEDLLNIGNVLQRFQTSVIVTSDVRLAMGHTVVLDGGVVVFEGDASEARQVVSNLHWLTRIVD